MTELRERITHALDEARMLILGVQILFGVQLRVTFQPAFQELSERSQWLQLGALGLIALAVTLLLWPSAYHRIVARGRDTRDVHRFVSGVTWAALLPFAFGMGLSVFVTTEHAVGEVWGLALGVGSTLLALGAWYVLGAVGRSRRRRRDVERLGADEARRREDEERKEAERIDTADREEERRGEESSEAVRKDPHSDDGKRSEEEQKGLDNRIRHVLTEIRTVLPGAQALLGFQLSVVFMEGFEDLPGSSKAVYVVTLALLSLGVILLMLPAAYHRIAEQGENTERFHGFASKVMLVAMVVIGLALSASLFIVLRSVSNDTAASGVAAGGLLALTFALWFGYTFYRRRVRLKL